MAYVTVKVWFTAKPVTLAYTFLYCIAVSFTAGTAWPDLANYRHFGKNLHVFDNFLTVYILSCKMVSLHWQICYIIGLVFIVANGQILKNNLTIWLHWAGSRLAVSRHVQLVSFCCKPICEGILNTQQVVTLVLHFFFMLIWCQHLKCCCLTIAHYRPLVLFTSVSSVNTVGDRHRNTLPMTGFELQICPLRHKNFLTLYTQMLLKTKNEPKRGRGSET